MTTATSTIQDSPTMPSHYSKLLDLAREANLIGGSMSILGWDQEVLMPEGGIEYRGRQLALLAKVEHQMSTSSAFADALAECEADGDLVDDPTSPSAVNLRELRWSLDRRTKLPAELVEEEAKLTSEGMHAWKKARAESDFSAFAPFVEEDRGHAPSQGRVLRLGRGRRAVGCAGGGLREGMYGRLGGDDLYATA